MSEDGTDAGLLERIEAYFDAVPRPAADVEEHGALTLFVSRIPWRFYGRPRLGLAEDVGADDVAAVRARQRELGIAERFEWVHETTPSMAGAAAAAGLEVTRVPLLALDADAWAPVTPPPGITVRMLSADDAALESAYAVTELGFAAEGMDIGETGAAARDAAVRAIGDLSFVRDRLGAGLTAMAIAEDAVDGAVSAGSHQPSGDVVEVTGIATLPAARRRGIGLTVTGQLVEDARRRGASLVFLSAADDAVARLYERVGFRRLGTACFGRAADDRG